MAIGVQEYVGQQQTVIFIEDDANGPYVPLSLVTQIGMALITAVSAAAGRGAIAAAGAGINRDILQLQGMSATDAAAYVVTPGGLLTLANLAALMGLSGGVTRAVTAATTMLDSDGCILADTDGGEFAITIPRALGQAGGTKTCTICKSGAGVNPLILQDDLGTRLPLTLIQGGLAFAQAVIIDGVAWAFGTP